MNYILFIWLFKITLNKRILFVSSNQSNVESGNRARQYRVHIHNQTNLINQYFTIQTVHDLVQIYAVRYLPIQILLLSLPQKHSGFKMYDICLRSVGRLWKKIFSASLAWNLLVLLTCSIFRLLWLKAFVSIVWLGRIGDARCGLAYPLSFHRQTFDHRTKTIITPVSTSASVYDSNSQFFSFCLLVQVKKNQIWNLSYFVYVASAK